MVPTITTDQNAVYRMRAETNVNKYSHTRF